MTPKQKKFTKLKKVILLDREQKHKSQQDGTGENENEANAEKEEESENEEESEEEEQTNETKAEESKDEETQEDQMSSAQRFQELAKLPKIPVTAPREYVTQVMTEELNKQVQFLISELTRFYERQKKTNPMKVSIFLHFLIFKAKKRYISGLNEVLRGVERKKVKCLIVAPNIDNVAAPGTSIYQ